MWKLQQRAKGTSRWYDTGQWSDNYELLFDYMLKLVHNEPTLQYQIVEMI